MGVVRGLGNINKHVADTEARFNKGSSGESDAPRTTWFKLADKQSVKVVFLQELDEDSENFSKKNDLGFLAVEHVNPDSWMRKAVCTIDDEGACYGCEQHRKDWKAGWKQKTRLYINVLVDEGNGKEPYVALLSQGNGPKSITPTLIEYAGDDETITDKWFSIKRTGSGPQDTSYTLRAGKAHDLNVEDYELFDLEKNLRQVPYAQQEAHFRDGVDAKPEESASPAPEMASAGTSRDSEW